MACPSFCIVLLLSPPWLVPTFLQHQVFTGLLHAAVPQSCIRPPAGTSGNDCRCTSILCLSLTSHHLTSVNASS